MRRSGEPLLGAPAAEAAASGTSSSRSASKSRQDPWAPNLFPEAQAGDCMLRSIVAYPRAVKFRRPHEVSLDTQGWRAGCYFCRLVTPAGSRTRTMVVVR